MSKYQRDDALRAIIDTRITEIMARYGRGVIPGTTASNIAPVPSSGGAPSNAQYLTLTTDATLTAERTLAAGAGLTGTDGGAGAAYTLAVGAGAGITVNADDVALTTPGTLTVSTSNTATGSHTHAVTSSSNPGANARLLATDASGYLSLVRLTATDRVVSPLITSASGNITLTPASTSVILSDSRAIATTTFASGFTGSGFRIDQGISYASQTTAEFDNLIVRGLMRVYELVINKIRVSRGSLIVSPGGGKVASVSGSGPYTLNFEDDHGLAANDLLRAQKFTGSGTYQSLMTVSSVTDSDTVVATLNSGSAPAAGYEYAVTGNTSNAARQGVLYLTADDSGSPFMDIVAGLSAHSGASGWGSASLFRTRVGRLDGITSGTNEYGLYAGDGTASTDQYIRVSNSAVLLNNVPIQLYNGGSQTVNIDSAGTDIWVGASTSDRRLTWDGSNLRVRGSLIVGPGVGFTCAPEFYCGYDTPTLGNTVNANGHRGQPPTISGGVIGTAGKFFGGSVTVGEATTNRILNPSVETNTTGYASDTGTLARSTDYALFGTYSLRYTHSSGGSGNTYYNVSGTLATSTTFTFSVYARRGDGAAVSGVTCFIDSSLATITPTISAVGNGWYRIYATRAIGGSLGNHIVGITGMATDTTWYFDGWQCEALSYVTPYVDGSLVTSGVAWTGTAHASTSTRTAASLAYPVAGNIPPAKGSLSMWVLVEYWKTGGAILWSAGAANTDFQGQISQTGIVQLYVNGNVCQHQTAAAAGWHHVAFTWDVSANQTRVYLDGVVCTTAGTTGSTPPPLHASTLQIGCSSLIGSGYNFNGAIDEVAILDTVLSADDVSAIYESDAPLNIARSNYELVLTDAGAGRVNANAGGIYGVDSGGKPTFTLLNSAATVNGESLGAGDTLLGDNSSNKGNVLFDQSAGSLIIRTGTTNVLSFGSTGSVDGVLNLGASGGIWQGSSGSFGSPTTGLKLYRNGTDGWIEIWKSGEIAASVTPDYAFSILAGSSFSGSRALNFFDSSSNRVGELIAYTTSSVNYVQTRARSTSSSKTAGNWVMSFNTASTGNSRSSLYSARGVDLDATPPTVTYPLAAVYAESKDSTGDATCAMVSESGASDKAYITVVSNGTTQTNTYVADNHNFTGTKSGFIIDHPLDPENKWLIHSPVESDRLRVVYDGEVTLDGAGAAVVTMPEWFAPLAKNVRVMVTCVDAHMPVYVTDIRARRFTIAGGSEGRRVFWTLSAERADPWAEQRPLAIETDKPDDERGTLFAWREYGASEIKSWRRRTQEKLKAKE
jgi:hypothetical protein